MTDRFSDRAKSEDEGNFRPRKPILSTPLLVALYAGVVTVSLFLIGFTDSTIGKLFAAGFVALCLMGLLSFTLLVVQRTRDMALDSDFQNLLFASAARADALFCVILKKDGTVVYFDPGFQENFPEFYRVGQLGLDTLLASSGISEEERRGVMEALWQQQSFSLRLPAHAVATTDKPVNVLVTALARPRGYFAVRGFAETDSPTPAASAHSHTASAAMPPAAVHGGNAKQWIGDLPLPTVAIGQDGVIRCFNAAFAAFVSAPDKPFAALFAPASQPAVTAFLQRAWRERVPLSLFSLELPQKSGTPMIVSAYASPVPGSEEDILLVCLVDTTEQKNLETRFAHSQKMQAVGQLAGGVAHDFNNLLTAMIGFCDLLLMRHPAGDPSFADIMQIKQNANRAANLVRQLLAFSRRQTLQPKVVDITDLLAELSNLVRRLIGENIQLNMIHGRDIGTVKADQGQLEQVIINLAVNARDAMLGGGSLTIRTSNAVFDAKPVLAADIVPPTSDEVLPAGDYILIEIADTGAGIPPALMQKIFEPFFSTKEIGSGTGLGLSTVYGIVKQTGGYVFLKSAEGTGTVFYLYLPRYQGTEEAPKESEAEGRGPAADLSGKGTVLLVEDETPVRIFAARALRNKGYTVLEAESAEAALEVMEKQGGEVEVVVTDVVMPGMNGPAMVEQLLPRFPGIKVIFMSGYAEDAFAHSFGSNRDNINFLAKPFTLKQLASKVKEVRDGEATVF